MLVVAGRRNIGHLALEAGKAVLAEILQAARLGAVLRFATFGETIDTAVGNIVTHNAHTVAVELFDVGQHLRGTVSCVSVLFKITDLLFEHVLDVALVTQIFQQRVAVDDGLRVAIIALGTNPLDTRFLGLLTSGGIISWRSDLVQCALEIGEAEFTEVLQTTCLGAIFRVAAAGVAVDAIVTDVVTGQTVTVGVEGFDVFEQLYCTKCSVRVLGVITHLSDQILFGLATVASPAETFEQRVIVNDFLRRTLVIRWQLPLDTGIPGLLNGLFPGLGVCRIGWFFSGYLADRGHCLFLPLVTRKIEATTAARLNARAAPRVMLVQAGLTMRQRHGAW